LQKQIPAVQRLAISYAESHADRELEKQELSELERNFKSHIQKHLDDNDSEAYDLVWEWEKFLFDKGQQI
jgi:hypothetical protein